MNIVFKFTSMKFLNFPILQKTGIVFFPFILSNLFPVKVSAFNNGALFTNCGGKLEEPFGIIQSPNFPKRFPTPILCEWVIHAPRDKKIIIYFTQYYLTDRFDVLEYDYYLDRNTHAGELKLATVNAMDKIWSVAGHKEYVVLRFFVQQMGNIHIRVLDQVDDVFGFNITYEFADRKSSDIKKACSVHICSLLGDCMASANFSEYKCHCFPEYFGEECQYGPHCDPKNNRNMCMNNGKCRYFEGAYVNFCDCPPGFHGAKCELREDGVMSDVCKEMGCQQQCMQISTNQSVCACNDGFQLNPDNKTCKLKDRYRVSFSVHPADEFNQIWRRASLEELHMYLADYVLGDLYWKMHEKGMNTTDGYSLGGFRDSSKGVEFLFLFYIEKQELPRLSSVLSEIVKFGSLGPMFFKDTFMAYNAEPELHIFRVASRVGDYDSHPAIEGRDMTLSCAAKGSQNIKFAWYKDGSFFDPKLSIRDAFETNIQSSTEEIIRSVLTIDSVTPFDKGTFTCVASDYDMVKNKSVIVDVITLPLVDVDPLSSSVSPGDTVTVRCMSPDDTLNSFKYDWFTDGYLITPGNAGRIVEDLSPIGSRLVVDSIKTSSNFTCRVTNEAGSVNVTAHIYVPKRNETSLICEEIFYKDVMWRRTGRNHFDKQRCPTETGDFNRFGHRDVGYATRRCECDGTLKSHCYWAQPNFASCQSLILVDVYDQIEMLRLGYQNATLKGIYDTLNKFVIQRKDGLYSGDIEMSGGILLQLLRHLRHYPFLADRDQHISTKSIIHLLNIILQGSSEATSEEMQTLHTGTTILKISELLAGGLIHYLSLNSSQPYAYDLIEMRTRTAYFQKGKGQRHPTLQFVEKKRRRKRKMRDLVSLNAYDKPVEIIEFTYMKLHRLLQYKTLRQSVSTARSLSNIHSAYVYPSKNYTFKEVYADLPIKHVQKVNQLKPSNISECLSWKFDSRREDFGRWVNDDCTVLRTSTTYTMCRCPLPGHFMVVSVHQNITIAPIEKDDYSGIYIMVGCIVLMCGVATTLGIYILKWKQLVGGEYLINLNFLICVLFLNVLFLACIHQRHVQIVCLVFRVLIYFLFLGAFSFLLMESIHMLLMTNTRDKLTKYCLKYSVLGWSLPFALTVFFTIASELFGRDSSCSYMCWVSRGHWQFYGFVVPMIIIVIVYFVVTIVGIRVCYMSKEEWKINKRRKLIYAYSKSSIILLLLVAISQLSVDISGQQQTIQIFLLLLCQLLLALFIFIFRGILDKQLLIVFWRMKGKKRKKRLDANEEKLPNGSFRTFIRSDRVEEDGKEETSVNKYYEEVNRLHFTSERKKHLQALLGSNNVARGARNSILGDSSTYMMRQGINHRFQDNFGTDSGISVASESEKFNDSCSDVATTPSNNGFSHLSIKAHVHEENHSSNYNLGDSNLYAETEEYPLKTFKHNDVIYTSSQASVKDSVSPIEEKIIKRRSFEDESKDELSILLHSIDYDD